MNKSYLNIAAIFACISAAVKFVCASAMLMIFLFGYSYVSSYVISFFPQIFRIAILVATGAIDIVAAGKLKNAEKGLVDSNAILWWSIYLLVFSGIIAGVFGLMASTSANKSGENFSAKPGDLEAKLKELDSLYDKGLITKEEYSERRKRIISNI